MNLIQILLPIHDNQGKPFSRSLHQKVTAELAQRYKGLTAYTHTPADGLWKNRGRTNSDQIVIYEVMAENKNVSWWRSYRGRLEKRFKQRFVVIRSQKITLF